MQKFLVPKNSSLKWLKRSYLTINDRKNKGITPDPKLVTGPLREYIFSKDPLKDPVLLNNNDVTFYLKLYSQASLSLYYAILPLIYYMTPTLSFYSHINLMGLCFTFFSLFNYITYYVSTHITKSILLLNPNAPPSNHQFLIKIGASYPFTTDKSYIIDRSDILSCDYSPTNKNMYHFLFTAWVNGKRTYFCTYTENLHEVFELIRIMGPLPIEVHTTEVEM